MDNIAGQQAHGLLSIKLDSKQGRIIQQETTMTSTLFPRKLHKMLNEAELNGEEHIVSWLPCGTAFRVHKREEFVNTIMKRHFNQSKFKSFQRQLNLWSFQQRTEGLPSEKGCYSHPNFVGGKPNLSDWMIRIRIKSKCVQKKEDTPPCPESRSTCSSEDRSIRKQEQVGSNGRRHLNRMGDILVMHDFTKAG